MSVPDLSRLSTNTAPTAPALNPDPMDQAAGIKGMLILAGVLGLFWDYALMRIDFVTMWNQNEMDDPYTSNYFLSSRWKRVINEYLDREISKLQRKGSIKTYEQAKAHREWVQEVAEMKYEHWKGQKMYPNWSGQ